MNMRGLNKSGVLNGLNRVQIFALWVGIFLFATLPVRSQTNVAKSHWVSNRYLLIVETSHSMHRRSDGVIKTAANLLMSGIGGQIQQSDTLGVWTYNQELYAGRFPLKRWATIEQQDISSAVLDFLKKQKYENAPAFSSVRPALDKVIKDSESITVILISSGEEAMTGTPFDDQINELYKNWRAEQEKTRMPIVTVLRAKRGKMVGFSVTPPPWQIEIPSWPAEPSVTKVAAPPPPKVQPSTVPPLIVTGKKPKLPETTNSTETATITAQAASSGPQNQSIKTTKPSAESTGTQPPGIVEQNPATNLPPEAATVLERKVEKAELPQHRSEPKPAPPKELASSSPALKPAPAPPVAAAANRSSPSIAAQTPPKSDSPPQEVASGIAVPGPGLLSNKTIWIAGLAVFVVSCAMLTVLARRARTQHISLITRSLERGEK
jgi:hypothetical protein